MFNTAGLAALAMDNIGMTFDPAPTRQVFPDLPDTGMPTVLKELLTGHVTRDLRAAYLAGSMDPMRTESAGPLYVGYRRAPNEQGFTFSYGRSAGVVRRAILTAVPAGMLEPDTHF